MKKLIEALHVIQDECKKHVYDENQECSSCPMWSDESHVCCVTDVEPDNWSINDTPLKALL